MKHCAHSLLILFCPTFLIAQTVLDESGSSILRNSPSITEWTGTTALTLTATAAQTSGFQLSYEADANPRVGRLTLNNNWNGIFGDFAISLRNSNGTFERFRITNNGNVGIGTVLPAAKLEIDAGTGAYPNNKALRIFANGASPTYRDHVSVISDLNSGYGIAFAGLGYHRGGIYAENIGGTENPVGKITVWSRSSGDIILNAGRVGIGTTTPDSKLTVKGIIHAEEVKVDLNVPGPDYVFEESYLLTSLEDTKAFIDQNKHLPGIPSSAEMQQNSVNLLEMNMKLLEKVEEMMLYILQLSAENKTLRMDLDQLQQIVTSLKVNENE